MLKWFLIGSLLLSSALASDDSPGPIFGGERRLHNGPRLATSGFITSPVQMRKVPNDFWYNNKFEMDVSATEGSGQAFVSEPTWAMWHMGDAYLDMERAWGIYTGSDDVLVGVIDQEVGMLHYDFIDNLYTNPLDPINGLDDDGNGLIDDFHGWDWYQDDPYPWASASTGTDMELWYNSGETQHGSQMASLLGAQGNNEPWAGTNVQPNRSDKLQGSVGIMWDVGIVPFRTISGGDGGKSSTRLSNSQDGFSNRAAEYLAEMNANGANVRVASMSYVGTTKYAISRLIDAGILPVVGSGNGNTSTPGLGARSFNIACDNDSLLCVGVVKPDGKTGNVSSGDNFSMSFGTGVSLVAYTGTGAGYFNFTTKFYTNIEPGYSSGPSMFTLGFTYSGQGDDAEGVLKWKGNMHDGPQPPEFDDVYGILPTQGYTSGGTAQVAGVALLVSGLYPQLGPLELREQVLRGTITDIYDGRNDDQCASGDCAGLLGTGRISAYRAMTLWGAVSDTLLTGDIWIGGDIAFDNVTIASGSTLHIAVNDMYEDEIDNGTDFDCQPQFRITATIDNRPSPAIKEIEILVTGELVIAGPVLFKGHSFGNPAHSWGGIFTQATGEILGDENITTTNTTGGEF